MDNRKIIKVLAATVGRRPLWDTFGRYIRILDNYLDGYDLSRVEPKNYRHNRPRRVYLDLLAQGMKVSVDYQSVKLAGLDLVTGKMFYKDDSYFYFRFFRRLEEARKAGVELTPQVLEDLVMMGEAIFPQQYPNLIPVDPN